MSSRDRIRQEATPNPGYPSNPNREAGQAYSALANNVFAPQHATGNATSGSLYQNIGVVFVPKVSGKLLVIWNASGTGANATSSGTFQPNVDGTAGLPAMSVGAKDDGSNTFNVGGAFIATVPVNVPVNANITYTSNNGMTFPNGQGSMEIIELPA